MGPLCSLTRGAYCALRKKSSICGICPSGKTPPSHIISNALARRKGTVNSLFHACIGMVQKTTATEIQCISTTSQYAYKAKEQSMTGASLFRLALSCQHLGPPKLVIPPVWPTNYKSTIPTEVLRKQLLPNLFQMQHNANKRIKAARKRYKKHPDGWV